MGPEGGSKNFYVKTAEEHVYQGTQKLSEYMTLSWRAKPHDCYFFKAESFFNVATHIDRIAQHDFSIYESYGGKSLHVQSHGESFLAFFKFLTLLTPVMIQIKKIVLEKPHL